MPPTSDALARIRAEPLEAHEVKAIVEAYTDGQCLTYAFALSWMTGWPVEAVSERSGDAHVHFAAVSPDGLVWDAAGPRTRERAAEDDVSEAAVAAVRMFGASLDAHISRLPDLTGRVPSPC